MNKGIEILLERMKSNPDEFVGEGVYSKWNDLFSMYKDALDPEDIKTYEDARKALIQEHFTQAVMKELLAPKSENNPYIVKSAMPMGGATLGRSSVSINNTNAVTGNITLQANSLTLGQTRLQEQELQHMKAHLEYLKMQQAQEQAKHKTLVGKLYNYLHPMAGK